eukprot:Gb_05729 [translate_table: standard]
MPPMRQGRRCLNPKLSHVIEAELNKLLEANFIYLVEYAEWLASIVSVMKKNRKIQICVDYRDLNKETLKDPFELPFIDMLLDDMASKEVYSFMDGFSGYNQIWIDPDDRIKTAFRSPWGIYAYRVMPFGLTNALATFQRTMTEAFKELVLNSWLAIYLDDFSVNSKVRVDHMNHLRGVFEKCREFQICLNLEKCVFETQKGCLLGFIVSQVGIESDPEKLHIIRDLPPPTDRTGVRSILGKIGFYRRFIRDYTQVTEPINNLLKNEVSFVWTSECQRAFDELKERMLQAPILVPHNWSQRFFLYILAGGKALGAILMQQDGNRVEHAVYFAGRTLNESELKYDAVEKEILALIYASKKLRHYLLPKPFTVFSNYNPLHYLLSKPDIKGLTGRWILLL